MGAFEIEGPYRNTAENSADTFWYGGGKEAYASLDEALRIITAGKRRGTTFGVWVDGIIKEYWWPTAAILDTDCVEKVKDTAGTTQAILELQEALNQLKAKYDKVNNTADIDKIISRSTAAALSLKTDKTYVDLELLKIRASILDLDAKIDLMPAPFFEYMSFYHDGVSKTKQLAYTPVGIGNVFLNSQILNPFIDYRYDGSTIVFNDGVLRTGQIQNLIINYLK